MMRGKIESSEAIRYMVVQILGAVLAALVSMYILGGDTFSPGVGAGHTAMQALLAEFLFSFALVLVILNVATSDATEGNSYYGLAIGFTVMAGAFAVESISGAAFNPAVAIGSTIVDAGMGSGSFSDIWIYLVGPFGGGVVAAMVFKFQAS